jgi:cyclopropane fatty-acyl-phospholipid synthase-like methyltransferase
MAQADTLAHELRLSAGDRLLDLGSGRGWRSMLAAIHAGLLRRALFLARTR